MISLDLSDLVVLEREADRWLGARVNATLIKVTEEAAAKERRTHPYQNRTGQLERMTVAKVISGPDPSVQEVVMDRPYASFVQNRGYTDIERHIEEARKDFDSYCDAAAYALERV